MEILERILKKDPDAKDDLLARNQRGGIAAAEGTQVSSEAIRHVIEAATSDEESGFFGGGAEEAVILWDLRPSLLIKNDSYEQPANGPFRNRLAEARNTIERVIPAVGRIELIDHWSNAMTPFVGTGWLIAEDVIVTNQHVARIFAETRSPFRFLRDPDSGEDTKVRVDFKEEHGGVSPREVGVAEVLFIEEEAGADMAFLKLNSSTPFSEPVPLKDHREDEFVAAIGYPGQDKRAPEARLRDVFKEGYAVKRLAPGQIMDDGETNVFYHDCSTLKGSSGSVIMSLESGAAVGLHYSGRFNDRNKAVTAARLRQKLADMNIAVPVPAAFETVRSDDETSSEEKPASAEGYLEDFLGENNRVPMPGLDLSGAQDENGEPIRLDYTHFSVLLHRDRKLALATACNIDGNQLRRIPRSGEWRLDARKPETHHGNELYKRNPYDRGHLVRRLDPVWGDSETAKRANDDTFFFTNSAPQHERLNQQSWLALEDYILDNANTHDLKVSVFTGCVFDAGDPTYRDVQIPRRFWKIVAFKDATSGALRASGYALDQSHLMNEITEEFAFGAFGTFQISIASIADSTGLDLSTLRAADVLNRDGSESFAIIPINRLSQMRF